ncbi:MAG: ribosome biogenesis GTPase YlqF [Clostridia bacterium]
MTIQWFPGHMTKALRLIDDNVKLVDGFIYVLDARAPYSSLNPEFLKRMNSKPFLYVLNKADMANDTITAQWKTYFTKLGVSTICVNSTQTNATRQVYQEILKMMREKLERHAAKGISKSVRIMVIGIPNCGKSTLINNFIGKKRALTGDKPGVTKGKQWIAVDDRIDLLDTPGTLYPSFENQEVAKNVAFVGSINDDILDIEGLALDLIKKLYDINPSIFVDRFGIEATNKEPLEIYEAVCKKRGYVLKGGEFDYSRLAKVFIDEFRKGKLGNISLETPEASYVRI